MVWMVPEIYSRDKDVCKLHPDMRGCTPLPYDPITHHRHSHSQSSRGRNKLPPSSVHMTSAESLLKRCDVHRASRNKSCEPCTGSLRQKARSQRLDSRTERFQGERKEEGCLGGGDKPLILINELDFASSALRDGREKGLNRLVATASLCYNSELPECQETALFAPRRKRAACKAALRHHRITAPRSPFSGILKLGSGERRRRRYPMWKMKLGKPEQEAVPVRCCCCCCCCCCGLDWITEPEISTDSTGRQKGTEGEFADLG
ncbi:hypothetical protein INR49_015050 [Caranx melampygus]|nr:hypothetical protein INR49_015050 [Caranx melampygus]